MASVSDFFLKLSISGKAYRRPITEPAALKLTKALIITPSPEQSSNTCPAVRERIQLTELRHRCHGDGRGAIRSLMMILAHASEV
ncbi:hypothetical protein CDAR_556711 [Caerostris darwini]|uniref:Uncharacterized protein n=1 Tax=Caerostris darwini TaxID=1538125 RepID=A0AAV4WQ03_9ARAC|nr:hypothetical protein CDAR_556711 [Caerostris darwini]